MDCFCVKSCYLLNLKKVSVQWLLSLAFELVMLCVILAFTEIYEYHFLSCECFFIALTIIKKQLNN